MMAREGESEVVEMVEAGGSPAGGGGVRKAEEMMTQGGGPGGDEGHARKDGDSGAAARGCKSSPPLRPPYKNSWSTTTVSHDTWQWCIPRYRIWRPRPQI